jgi:branched-chain amino acid transport system permease protein
VTDIRRIEAARERYRSFDQHSLAPVVKGVVWFGVLLALPLLLPWEFLGVGLADFVTLKVLLLTVLFAYLSQSWNLMSGFTGYFSFGHAAFFGIGAYATLALLSEFGVNPWIGMLVGSVLAVVYALFMGVLSFRFNLKGHYFALATLAFAELLRYVIANMNELNASNGYYKPFPEQYADGYGLLAFQFQGDMPYYYLAVAFLAIVTVVAYLAKNSWIGLYFFAIREDEQAAESLGVPVYRYKLIGLSLSAFFTAWAGTFWAMYFNTIRPSTVFDIFRNVDIILPAVIGGPGTLVGPIIGAFAVTPVAEYLRTTFDSISGLDRIIYGFLLVLIPIFTPRGMVSWPKRARDLRAWAADRFGGDSDD